MMRDVRSIARVISNNLLFIVAGTRLPSYLGSVLSLFHLSYILFLCFMTQLVTGVDIHFLTTIAESLFLIIHGAGFSAQPCLK